MSYARGYSYSYSPPQQLGGLFDIIAAPFKAVASVVKAAVGVVVGPHSVTGKVVNSPVIQAAVKLAAAIPNPYQQVAQVAQPIMVAAKQVSDAQSSASAASAAQAAAAKVQSQSAATIAAQAAKSTMSVPVVLGAGLLLIKFLVAS